MFALSRADPVLAILEYSRTLDTKGISYDSQAAFSAPSTDSLGEGSILCGFSG